MSQEIQNTQLGDSVQTMHLSIWDLIINADWVVQFIILILLAASVWSWTIIIAKSARLKALNKDIQKFEDAFWSGNSLEQLYESMAKRNLNPMSSIFMATMKEWQRPKTRATVSLTNRLQRIITVSINRELDSLEKNMTFLASTGSTAPFIGLFGTVWGIMNSFQSIAGSQSTNLAVVAPGIAEALFATAIGLVAAIPAVLAYNKINSQINRFSARLESFSDELMTILSRQIEETV